MNIQNLNRGYLSSVGSHLRSRIGNAYDQIAAGSDYKKNTRDLRIIQGAVVTVVMIS